MHHGMDGFRVVAPVGHVNVVRSSCATDRRTSGCAARAAAYTGGIYDSDECGSTAKALDHAVLLIGYNTDKKSRMDY